MATKMPTNRAARPTATRIRQLQAATRSSQDGTRAGSSGRGPGSRIAIVAPATANTMAATGTAAKRPMTPASSYPAGSTIRTMAGWMWTLLPYTIGRMP